MQNCTFRAYRLVSQYFSEFAEFVMDLYIMVVQQQARGPARVLRKSVEAFHCFVSRKTEICTTYFFDCLALFKQTFYCLWYGGLQSIKNYLLKKLKNYSLNYSSVWPQYYEFCMCRLANLSNFVRFAVKVRSSRFITTLTCGTWIDNI